MVPITIIRHSDGKFRVWAPCGPVECNGIDEARAHAERLKSKHGGPENAQIFDYTIRIAINKAAFEAIAATLPPGTVGFDRQATAKGERQVFLHPAIVDQLRARRGRGESYSDVILRLKLPDCWPKVT